MSNPAMAAQTGRLRLSHIIYHTDLQRQSAVIPLGVMAEVVAGPVRFLSLMALRALAAPDAAKIASAYREKLIRPFAFLQQDFDRARAETPHGAALSKLARTYQNALFFSPPVDQDIPIEAGSALDEWALKILRQHRNAAFDSLFKHQPVHFEVIEAP